MCRDGDPRFAADWIGPNSRKAGKIENDDDGIFAPAPFVGEDGRVLREKTPLALLERGAPPAIMEETSHERKN